MKRLLVLLVGLVLLAGAAPGETEPTPDIETAPVSAVVEVDDETPPETSEPIFSPQDVSDATIQSIQTYDDYLLMFQKILEDYWANYEDAIKDTVLYSPESFAELKEAREESLEEQKELYGDMGDTPIVGKDSLVQFLINYRDSLKTATDSIKSSLSTSPGLRPEPTPMIDVDGAFYSTHEFDPDNKMSILYSKGEDSEDGTVTVMMSLDGKNVMLEKQRIAALIGLFGLCEQGNYMITFTTGDNSGMIMFENDKAEYVYLPTTYDGKIDDVDTGAARDKIIEFLDIFPNEIETLGISKGDQAKMRTVVADLDEAAPTDAQNASLNGSDINLRSGPGTDYDVVAKVSEPSSVTILGQDGDWYEVEVEGETGYLREDFVNID